MFHHSFNISNGFLPVIDPLVKLPVNSSDQEELKLNEAINTIIEQLPLLLKTKKLRKTIDALNEKYADQGIMLSHHHAAQKQIALVFLSFLAQAYIFEQSDFKKHVVPSIIGKNLYHLCYLGQRRPMLTYNEFVLNNWQRIDKTLPITIDNIKPIVTFTGTDDEAWFIKIHVAIEAVCARAMRSAKLIHVLTNTRKIEDEKVETAKDLCMLNDLNEITSALSDATHLMHRMKEGCNPTVFWEKLRFYFSGWNTLEADEKGRKGVTLQGVNEKDNNGFQYFGPSGAQSSIVPALDAVLNVKHDINSMFEHLSHFEAYMPKAHRAFILNLSFSDTRQYIKQRDNQSLMEAYDRALNALWKFRGAHMSLLHDYIYKPAAKEGTNQKEVMGTGGSPLQYYLSARFKATREHKILKQSI